MGPARRASLLGAAAALTILAGCGAAPARGQPPALTLERILVLKDVAGRVDHMAVDAPHGRLFVAELGAGSVEALDIAGGGSLGRIRGLSEPQGLAYLPERDELAVATGGDGMLRFYRAADLRLVAAIRLGDDADNVHIDRTTGRVVVGFGSGALAVVDPATRQVVGQVALAAHPEGFEIERGWAYVNLPEAGRIVVADLATGRELAAWPNGWLKFNFPLALDRGGQVVAVAYRLPPRLAIFDGATGARRQDLGACGDADDLAVDRKRGRIYLVCGSGAVDVFQAGKAGYARLARVATRPGARTGLFVPQLDRLFVAARAETGSRDAAILVLRPPP